MTGSIRHRWGEKVRFGIYKSERQCLRCGLVKTARHESEGGRDIHWAEYYRDEELVSRNTLPACDARLEDKVAAGAEVTA